MRDNCRIDLASIAPFRIGALCVEPALRQVSIADTEPETLEPRVMLVLVALARAGGGIVSRDHCLSWISTEYYNFSTKEVVIVSYIL